MALHVASPNERTMAVKRPLTVTRYTDWPTLATFAPAWRRLRAMQPDATVFAGQGFARAIWRSFGDAPLELFAVSEGDEIVGIAPFTRRRMKRGGLQYNEIGFFRNHHTIRNSLLIAPDRQERVLSALIGEIARDRSWQVAFLENIPHQPSLLANLDTAATEHDLTRDPIEPGRQLCFARIDGTWNDYRASMSANMRQQLNKFRRRADQLGTVEFQRLSTRSAIADALPQVFDLQAKSWQGRARGDPAATAADHAFDLALLEDLDDDEIGDLWLMKIDRRLVASLRMLGDAGKRYVHTMHFDPAAKEVSPGTLLFEKMLEAAWAASLAEVDFHGDSTFFRRWTSLHREHVTTRLYSASVYGRLLKLGRRLHHHWRRPVADDAG